MFLARTVMDPRDAAMGVEDARMMPEFTDNQPKPAPTPPAIANIQMALGLEAEVKVVMGSTRMKFGDFAKLAPGTFIALNQRVTDPLEIVVNGLTVARGHGCVTDDETVPRFGIILTELVETNSG